MLHYANDAFVAGLDASLAEAKGQEHIDSLVALAWHLRQRDARRAEGLARDAQALLASAPPTVNPSHRPRLALTLAECALLLSRVEESRVLAEQARTQFAALGDEAGRGDAALVLSRVAEVRGARDQELGFYREALDAYRDAGDAQRFAHARGWALLASGFGDPAAMAAELADIRAQARPCSEALEVHLKFIEGVAAFQRNAFLEAVPLFNAVVTEAASCGLLEPAFRAEAGLVSAHSNLGDRESSCAVAERLLGRARDLGWPRAIGHALANLARQLSDTGQPERAVELLLEARAVLGDQPRARGFAIATYYLGDAYLALGRNAEALEHLRHAETLMRDLGSRPEVACLQAISAQALSRLGRVQEALDCAQAALALSRQTRSRLWEVEALRSLAEIHATHAPSTGTPQDASLALRYLDQALGVVESIGGHHEKSQLYTEIALAHEAAGDPVRALAAERTARGEEVRERDRRALNQLLLAQERHEIERAREKTRTLETALVTLEQLRQVGQDITAHLEAGAMLQALDRHLARLADVSFIAVFVLDPAAGRLRRTAIERGRLLPERDIAMADLESYAARVARERREIHVDAQEGGRPATRIPGTEVTRSLWFGPLLVKDQLLGVLTVQTSKVGAYAEREKLIFRTVSSYAAVALANAHIHGELEAKHRRLVGTEAEMRVLATTDPLSGLANRRQFLAAAESEVARASRYGGAIGLVMADLDRFKATNDALGHGAGDRLLTAVADVLREQQRPHDVIGRLGGDEFALVLPGADLASTQRVAERVREAVDALRVDWHGSALRATLSLGCTSAPESGPLIGDAATELARLMRTADAALYEAKRLGRNRAVSADSD